MAYILDTHTFLWFVDNDPALSARAVDIISGVTENRYISMASVWELAIKINTGKITISKPLEDFIDEHCRKTEIKILPIYINHIYPLASLHPYHKDPFDRMIISQAKVTGYAVISADTEFDKYGVKRIW